MTSFVSSASTVAAFGRASAMNGQQGANVIAIADPKIAKLVPPPLAVADPVNPIVCGYVAHIGDPEFAPWYLEGGLGVVARLGEQVGLYFLGLQLEGPGALMASVVGREFMGLPKKLCDQAVLERTGSRGRGLIRRDGVDLMSFDLEFGVYNEPQFATPQDAASQTPGGIAVDDTCFIHRFRFDGERFSDLEILSYRSPTKYLSWEPASADLRLNSSQNDPWGDVEVSQVLGAGWYRADSSIANTTVVHRYPTAEITETVRYLLTARFDQAVLGKPAARFGGAIRQ